MRMLHSSAAWPCIRPFTWSLNITQRPHRDRRSHMSAEKLGVGASRGWAPSGWTVFLIGNPGKSAEWSLWFGGLWLQGLRADSLIQNLCDAHHEALLCARGCSSNPSHPDTVWLVPPAFTTHPSLLLLTSNKMESFGFLSFFISPPYPPRWGCW